LTNWRGENLDANLLHKETIGGDRQGTEHSKEKRKRFERPRPAWVNEAAKDYSDGSKV